MDQRGEGKEDIDVDASVVIQSEHLSCRIHLSDVDFGRDRYR